MGVKAPRTSILTNQGLAGAWALSLSSQEARLGNLVERGLGEFFGLDVKMRQWDKRNLPFCCRVK